VADSREGDEVSAAYSFAIICEADADRRTATELADRLLCEKIAWLADVLDTTREWRGVTRADAFVRIQGVPKLARANKIRVRGKFDGHDGHVIRERHQRT
jgi:hypothetical protein